MEVNFSRKMKSKLSPSKLWRHITSALEDSAGHPFWPEELERSKSEGLRTDGTMQVTYKGLLGACSATYRIIDISHEQHVLRYESTQDHPHKGGATVRVIRSPRSGSELHWTGAYSFPWYSLTGALFPYFLHRFFSKLRRGLRDFEAEKRYRNHFAAVHKIERNESRHRKAAGL